MFILDFVNDPDTVVNAFRKYDTGAHMSEAQDPNVVYAIRRQLDRADVYTMDDFSKYRDAQYRAVAAARTVRKGTRTANVCTMRCPCPPTVG